MLKQYNEKPTKSVTVPNPLKESPLYELLSSLDPDTRHHLAAARNSTDDRPILRITETGAIQFFNKAFGDVIPLQADDEDALDVPVFSAIVPGNGTHASLYDKEHVMLRSSFGGPLSADTEFSYRYPVLFQSLFDSIFTDMSLQLVWRSLIYRANDAEPYAVVAMEARAFVASKDTVSTPKDLFHTPVVNVIETREEVAPYLQRVHTAIFAAMKQFRDK